MSFTFQGGINVIRRLCPGIPLSEFHLQALSPATHCMKYQLTYLSLFPYSLQASCLLPPASYPFPGVFLPHYQHSRGSCFKCGFPELIIQAKQTELNGRVKCFSQPTRMGSQRCCKQWSSLMSPQIIYKFHPLNRRQLVSGEAIKNA